MQMEDVHNLFNCKWKTNLICQANVDKLLFLGKWKTASSFLATGRRPHFFKGRLRQAQFHLKLKMNYIFISMEDDQNLY